MTGDLRLSAPSGRAGRHAALPELRKIKQRTIHQIVDQVMALGEGTRIQVMAPVIRGKKGRVRQNFRGCRKSGYVRVRVDGSMYDLSEEIKLEKNIKHNIEVVVDRLILKPDVVHRLSDSAETAAALSRRTGAYQRAQSRAGYSVLAELRLRGLGRVHLRRWTPRMPPTTIPRRVPGLWTGLWQPPQSRRSVAGHSE